MLGNLTLVVPTYERPAFALRNLRYWSGRGPKLLMVDGSLLALPKDALDGLSDNILYLHSPTVGADRLKRAADLIDTKYAALLADDEFFIPSSLEASIFELENDPTLVACMGRAMRFKTSPPGFVQGSPIYPKLAEHRLDSSVPRERAIAHMRNYVPATIYSVVRTEIWRAAHESFLRHEFPVYAIAEIQFELSVSLLGKSKILPRLHWLRSQEVERVTTGDDVSLKSITRVHTWWQSSNNLEEKLEFLKIMSSSIAAASRRPEREIAEEIATALDEYAAHIQHTKPGTKPAPSTSRRLRRLVASWAKHSGLLRDVKRPNGTRSLLDEADALVKSGVIVDFAQLKEIEETVAAFSRGRPPPG